MKRRMRATSPLQPAAAFLLDLHTHARSIVLAVIMPIFFATGSAFAGSATWSTTPPNGNWNSAPNWSPMTVPKGPADIATFGSSSINHVSMSADTDVSEIVFNSVPHPTSFFIVPSPATTLTVSGVGITNNSGVTQQFRTNIDRSGNVGTIAFTNRATAGSKTVFNNTSIRDPFGTGTAGTTKFFDSSNAGTATFNNTAAMGFYPGATPVTYFFDTSSAGAATFNNNGGRVDDGQGGGMTVFDGKSTADTAIINNGFGSTDFRGKSTAGAATIISNRFGFTHFIDGSSAGSATIINNGGATDFLFGNFKVSTADHATIINNGGTGAGALGGETAFYFGATAGNATLIANGGTQGGGGGSIQLSLQSNGGTARVEVFGNGNLDLRYRFDSGVTIGSLEGTGFVFLGNRPDFLGVPDILTVGSNNLSTVFSGVIKDGGANQHTVGGSLSKIGTGTLVLSGANSYTGGTTVNQGVLQVDNTRGSGTGTGPVTVNGGGKLSGTGTIAGEVINNGVVGPGSSPGTLHLDGNYSQSTGGTLDIEIASLVSFDQLAISGTASLGGTLDVILDGYTGHAGDIFTILTSCGLIGNFGTFDLPTLDNGLFFTESRTANNVLLTVNGPANLPDQGSTSVLMAGALAALLSLQFLWLGRNEKPGARRIV
jgi:autotransporter-associated beta strand protein